MLKGRAAKDEPLRKVLRSELSKERAEALLDYTKELKTAKGNGIGVRNVHERIQLHFGKEYGVQIISEEDEGTEILLHLPAIMYGEKKE